MSSRTTITDMMDLRDLLKLDPDTPRPLSHALTTDQQSLSSGSRRRSGSAKRRRRARRRRRTKS